VNNLSGPKAKAAHACECAAERNECFVAPSEYVNANRINDICARPVCVCRQAKIYMCIYIYMYTDEPQGGSNENFKKLSFFRATFLPRLGQVSFVCGFCLRLL